QLIKDKKIKKDKNESTIFRGKDSLFYETIGEETKCIQKEIPFEIPDSWEWCRLGFIGNWASGSTPQRTNKDYYGDGYPWLKTGDLTDGYIEVIPESITELALKECSLRVNPVGSILIAMYGATVGKLGILKFPATTNQACCSCLPIIVNNLYLFYYLRSHKNEFIKKGEGGAQPNISKEKIIATLFPLPPLSEQKRIVEEIEKLLPLVDDYGKNEEALSKLQKEFPNRLRKSILQEAIQGKLVSQDPNDEPASELLKKIKAEKEQLIKDKKIKKDKNESTIFRGKDGKFYETIGNETKCIQEEIPFDIPDSWEWCRWGTLSFSIQYGFNAPAQQKGRIKMVRISDIQNNQVLWDKVPFCEINESDIDSYKLSVGDILFARTGGTVGKSFLLKEVKEDAIFAGYLIRTKYSNKLSSEYLKFFMESQLYWIQLKDNTTATAQPNCNGQSLSRMLLPLPPLSEQKRIVEKLEEITSQIDLFDK
ncbi:MAG: restriction endonuclease subunit S, partial [Succinivibrionaceae bacterium]